MKKLITLLPFLFFFWPLHAHGQPAPSTGTFAVTFTAEAKADWVFVVEEKLADATWREVATTPTVAEIKYSTIVQTGAIYTVRMYGRSTANPEWRTPYSNEASTLIVAAPNAPGNVAIRLLIIVNVTP